MGVSEGLQSKVRVSTYVGSKEGSPTQDITGSHGSREMQPRVDIFDA